MTKPIELRIDLDCGEAPPPLARAYRDHIVATAFAALPGWCERCNDDLSEHHWQVVDETTDEQGGVIDCALNPANVNGASA